MKILVLKLPNMVTSRFEIRARKRMSWDQWTCRQAAENGHPECLKYAHENDVLGLDTLVLKLPKMVTSSV